MFQTKVNRNFTVGFPGDIAKDGPLRAMVFRLVPQATQALIDNARNQGNVMSRAFGWVGEVNQPGSTTAMLAPTAVVGGNPYAGILIHPKHHALYGGPDGALSPSNALPDGSEGELAKMAIIVAEIFNMTTGQQVIGPLWQIGYVSNAIADADDPLGVPFGALVAFPDGAALPAGVLKIDYAQVLNPLTLAASAVGALVSGLTILSITLG